MDSEKVIFEPHPVTPERKKELRQKGYKIVDAMFAPEGYEYPESEKQDESAEEIDLKDAEKLKKLKAAKLKEILGGLNVQFEANANKDELVALIVAAQ